MDTLSPENRSKRMSLIRAKDTKPELLIRRLIHAMGYRYRLHVRKLAGIPDLVFRGRKKVIFVHGCIWHGHVGCRLNRPPKTRLEYWLPKLEGNKLRDQENQIKLREQGWSVFVIWECETQHKNLELLSHKICDFLDSPT